MSDSLAEQIRHILNWTSRENESDTPDFLLAAYLMSCLEAGENLIVSRDKWYGHKREAAAVPKALLMVGDVISHRPRYQNLFFRFRKDSDRQFVFVEAIRSDNEVVFTATHRIMVTDVRNEFVASCSGHGLLSGTFETLERGFDAISIHLLRQHGPK